MTGGVLRHAREYDGSNPIIRNIREICKGKYGDEANGQRMCIYLIVRGEAESRKGKARAMKLIMMRELEKLV